MTVNRKKKQSHDNVCLIMAYGSSLVVTATSVADRECETSDGHHVTTRKQRKPPSNESHNHDLRNLHARLSCCVPVANHMQVTQTQPLCHTVKPVLQLQWIDDTATICFYRLPYSCRSSTKYTFNYVLHCHLCTPIRFAIYSSASSPSMQGAVSLNSTQCIRCLWTPCAT